MAKRKKKKVKASGPHEPYRGDFEFSENFLKNAFENLHGGPGVWNSLYRGPSPQEFSQPENDSHNIRIPGYQDLIVDDLYFSKVDEKMIVAIDKKRFEMREEMLKEHREEYLKLERMGVPEGLAWEKLYGSGNQETGE